MKSGKDIQYSRTFQTFACDKIFCCQRLPHYSEFPQRNKNAPAAAVENQTVEGYTVEKHPKFEVYTDKAGEFRFRLKATNGQIIAVSEGYKAIASCMNGIESVKKNAVDAPVVRAE